MVNTWINEEKNGRLNFPVGAAPRKPVPASCRMNVSSLLLPYHQSDPVVQRDSPQQGVLTSAAGTVWGSVDMPSQKPCLCLKSHDTTSHPLCQILPPSALDCHHMWRDLALPARLRVPSASLLAKRTRVCWSDVQQSQSPDTRWW